MHPRLIDIARYGACDTHDALEQDDALNCARGIALAVVVSIPVWWAS